MISAARFLATGFLSGYISLASGTAGSCAAMAVYFLWVGSGYSSLWLLLGSWILGIWAIRTAEEVLPGNDPGVIVIDEFCGFFAASLGFAAWQNPILAVVAAFFLFRFYDIFKPGPIGWAERLPGSWGIMMDDLMAGLCANITVRLLLYGARYFGYGG